MAVAVASCGQTLFLNNTNVKQFFISLCTLWCVACVRAGMHVWCDARMHVYVLDWLPQLRSACSRVVTGWDS